MEKTSAGEFPFLGDVPKGIPVSDLVLLRIAVSLEEANKIQKENAQNYALMCAQTRQMMEKLIALLEKEAGRNS